MKVRFGKNARTFELNTELSTHSSDLSLQRVQFCDAVDAHSFLRRHADADFTATFRVFLAAFTGSGVDKLSNDEVRQKMASLLGRGAMPVYEVNASNAPARKDSGVLRPDVVEAPRPIEEQVMLKTAWKSPAMPVTPPAPEEASPFEHIEQDAQVIALLAAAAKGVPFCEECFKAAQARAA